MIMLYDRDGNISIITQEKASLIELVKKMNANYDRYQHDNVIVNLTSLKWIQLEEIIEFLEISNRHRASNHSFVLVTANINYDYVPDELIIVPTLQEAYDIIEMEEMERDLGF